MNLQEEVAELESRINQMKQELAEKTELNNKEVKRQIQRRDILTVNGQTYQYKFMHSYDEGGDVYEILDNGVPHNVNPVEGSRARSSDEHKKNLIVYNRPKDENIVISCQLHFEGNIIDVSGKLTNWNSPAGVSNPKSNQQSCEMTQTALSGINNRNFEISFNYDMYSLTPKTLIVDNYWKQ
jgi:hypothetical protein